MYHNSLKKFYVNLFLIIISGLFMSCGTLETERDPDIATDEMEFPLYDGPVEKVQIIELSIPDEIVQKYPELKEKRIGWGMYNRLIDSLYDTGRFELIESKDVVKDKIIENWNLTLTGLAVEDPAIEMEGIKLARYLIYAEIYEFSVSKSTTAAVVAGKDEATTILGVQLRLVDVNDGSFIPGSGLGEATTISAGVWAPDLEFDQSTVGIATDKAVRSALLSLLKRMK